MSDPPFHRALNTPNSRWGMNRDVEYMMFGDPIYISDSACSEVLRSLEKYPVIFDLQAFDVSLKQFRCSEKFMFFLPWTLEIPVKYCFYIMDPRTQEHKSYV